MAERALDIIARMRQRIGILGMLEAALGPLLTPLFAARAWWQSLWAARALLAGRWDRFRGFHPQNALTSFFYANQWLNVSRYGLDATSPVVGLGDYPLSRWFHLSMLSSCLYAHAGAVCTLLGTLVWVSSHAIWLDAAPGHWVAAVMVLVFCSSTAFAMAFTRQNYNILGWMWLPAALFAVVHGQYGLAALTWLAASLASITVIAAALPLMLVQAWSAGTVEPLAALLPALLKVTLHLLPSSQRADTRQSIGVMGRVIGVVSRGTRYRRTSKRLRPFSAYFALIYLAGCAILTWDHGLPLLPLAALALFLVNQVWLRFADEQSVILMFVSVFSAHVLLAPPSLATLLALLLVLNPLPVFLSLCDFERQGSLVRVQTQTPFDHEPLQQAVQAFFAPVPAGRRILFAFEDPNDIYENVFDGYRTLLELPLFVCAERGIHLFPDWHAVAETNYPGSPNFWGRAPDQVRDNVRRWQASHVVVYGDAGEALDEFWAHEGFERLGVFDWAHWAEALGGHALWRSTKPPCWYLLRAPASSAVLTDASAAGDIG